MGNTTESLYKNKQHKVRKSRRNSKRNAILLTLLGVIVLVIAFFVIIFIVNNLQTKEEIQLLKQNEMYQLVEVKNNKKVNFIKYGNAKSENKIVTIADVGVNDFSVHMKQLFEPIKDKVEIAMIDRFGYGFSDDSKEEQTIENIVSTYRNTLTKEGFSPPYILLSNGFSSIYANYWAGKYPDEIKGIIYLDGTTAKNVESNEHTFKDNIKSSLMEFGFKRIFKPQYSTNAAKYLQSIDISCSKAMNMASVDTKALISEKEMMKQNINSSLNYAPAKDLPKLYISSTNGFVTRDQVIKYNRYINDINVELEQEEVTINADEVLAKAKKDFDEVTMPYTKELGNCYVTKIAGGKNIYASNPVAVRNALIDFIKVLNGDAQEIDAEYTDSVKEQWVETNKETQDLPTNTEIAETIS